MSDNPADSLRRELEAAFSAAYEEACKRPVHMGMTGPVTVAFGTIWPLVSAALEAARADERERAQRDNQELRERLRQRRSSDSFEGPSNMRGVCFD